jgi:hypothetical protein
MATVQTLITSARYDLRDYGKGLVFDNAELLDYLNRMVGLMDSTLASLDSDLVEAQSDGDITLASGAKAADISSALNSGLWDNIKDIWIDTDQLTQVSVDCMRRERIWVGSTTGQPYYWALHGTDILFERLADANYSLDIYYNKRTAALTITDSMPYNSIFDETFRELLVGNAKAKKEGRISRSDGFYSELFRRRAMQENLRRNFVPKPYSKDF